MVTNATVEKEMEHKGEQGKLWQKPDVSSGAAAVGEKARLGMKQCRAVQK